MCVHSTVNFWNIKLWGTLECVKILINLLYLNLKVYFASTRIKKKFLAIKSIDIQSIWMINSDIINTERLCPGAKPGISGLPEFSPLSWWVTVPRCWRITVVFEWPTSYNNNKHYFYKQSSNGQLFTIGTSWNKY